MVNRDNDHPFLEEFDPWAEGKSSHLQSWSQLDRSFKLGSRTERTKLTGICRNWTINIKSFFFFISFISTGVYIQKKIVNNKDLFPGVQMTVLGATWGSHGAGRMLAGFPWPISRTSSLVTSAQNDRDSVPRHFEPWTTFPSVLFFCCYTSGNFSV